MTSNTVALCILCPDEFNPSSNSAIQLTNQHSNQCRWQISLDSGICHSWTEVHLVHYEVPNVQDKWLYTL